MSRDTNMFGRIISSAGARYEDWMQRMLPPAGDEVTFWRRRIVLTVLLFGVSIGSLSYASTMVLSFRMQQWRTILLYTALYGWLFAVTFVRRLPFGARTVTALATSYFFGVSRLLLSGPVGSGRVWFFAFVFFTTIVWGLKAGLVAWVLSLL